MERLDKFLCDSGCGTRSAVKALIKARRVTVDGAVAKDPAMKVDPSQAICLDGEMLGGKRRRIFMLHKPAGYITANSDPVEKTVMELLPEQLRHLELNPVGRLDKETEGLLLFTNDGELLHRLISPKKEIPKVYYARHEGDTTQEDIAAFSQGLTLRDGTLCRPASLERVGAGESLITVCEGKYHQVRRMMASRGMHVLYLKRISEGALTLGELPLGQTRELTEEEIAALGILT